MNSDFLKDLVKTPSPSGMESNIQEVIRKAVKEKADDITIDTHGNLIACLSGAHYLDGPPKTKIMMVAHCDQIGMITTHIDGKGFISFDSVGGWDPQQLVGQQVLIHSKKRTIEGIIGKKPIHLMKPKERKSASKISSLWIDIGAKDKKEASKLVKLGDYITMLPNFNPLLNNNVIGTAFDDKAGIWAIVAAFNKIDKSKLKNTVYLVSSVQEEIGIRGGTTATYNINPDIGIAVDVTFATDCPSHNPKEQGEVSLGKGPVIQLGPNITPMVHKKLIKTCKKNKIPFQITASGGLTGTDARAIQVSRGGVNTGLVSIPNRYMHSGVEMVNFNDLDNIALLLSKFCMKTFK